jgi:hypothetical protein
MPWKTSTLHTLRAFFASRMLHLLFHKRHNKFKNNWKSAFGQGKFNSMGLKWKSKVRDILTTEQRCSVLVGRARVQTHDVPTRAARSPERQCDGVHHTHSGPRAPVFHPGSGDQYMGDLRYRNSLCSNFLLSKDGRQHPLNVCELHEWIMLGAGKSSECAPNCRNITTQSHTHTHTHAHTHKHTRSHAHVHMHTHVHTCTCIRTHMRTHTHTLLYTDTCAHTCAHTLTYTYTHVRTHSHIHTCTHSHRQTHTCTAHTCTHTCGHVHIHTCTLYHIHMHTHTYMHSSHMHAYTHTHRHTHIHIPRWTPFFYASL